MVDTNNLILSQTGNKSIAGSPLLVGAGRTEGLSESATSGNGLLRGKRLSSTANIGRAEPRCLFPLDASASSYKDYVALTFLGTIHAQKQNESKEVRQCKRSYEFIVSNAVSTWEMLMSTQLICPKRCRRMSTRLSCSIGKIAGIMAVLKRRRQSGHRCLARVDDALELHSGDVFMLSQGGVTNG